MVRGRIFAPANSEAGRRAVNISGYSRSKLYPFSSTRQDSKKYAEFYSCGRKTIGRVSAKKIKSEME